MKMLDLFSGIGGFHLAAEWVWSANLECVGHVEIDKFCQKVLKKHWPDVPIYDDVKIFKYDGEVDLITGGFPCQDISIAGKGAGIEGNRSGLWSEFKRIISEVRPQFALIENVPALTFRGLDMVLCDLAEIGYDAEWQSISAAEVGAWHKRERIWIIAYPTTHGKLTKNRQSINAKREKSSIKDEGFWGQQQTIQSNRLDDIQRYVANSAEIPDSERKRFNKGYESKKGQVTRFSGQQFHYWEIEPNVGRVAHGIPNRMDRLKSLGNSIVPQVAYIIMQQIKKVLNED